MLRLSGHHPHTEIFLLSATGLFLWTDDLSVRTQDVDEQHKALIELINQLYVAIRENRDKGTLREIFDQLTESAHAHFLFEESLMRLTQYAGYAAHKAQHEAVLEQLQTLQGKLDKESATISVELLTLTNTGGQTTSAAAINTSARTTRHRGLPSTPVEPPRLPEPHCANAPGGNSGESKDGVS